MVVCCAVGVYLRCLNMREIQGDKSSEGNLICDLTGNKNVFAGKAKNGLITDRV